MKNIYNPSSCQVRGTKSFPHGDSFVNPDSSSIKHWAEALAYEYSFDFACRAFSQSNVYYNGNKTINFALGNLNLLQVK